jgi:hypothetical protein
MEVLFNNVRYQLLFDESYAYNLVRYVSYMLLIERYIIWFLHGSDTWIGCFSLCNRFGIVFITTSIALLPLLFLFIS